MFGKSAAQRQAEAARPFRDGDRIRVREPAKFDLREADSIGLAEAVGPFKATLVVERHGPAHRLTGQRPVCLRSRQVFKIEDLEKI